MRKFLILLCLLFSTLSVVAENVTNVRVRQEGKSIIITYDLKQKSFIRILMASGNSNEYIELQAVTGNVGHGVPNGNNRKVVWKPLEEKNEFVAQNVRFKVEAQSSYEYKLQNAEIKTVVLGQVGYSVVPQLSYGAMMGQMYKGIGWYVSGRSNFQFGVNSDISCEAGGYIDEDMPFYNGNSYSTQWIVNAGAMINCIEWFSQNKFNTGGVYVGAGYGKRDLYWQTTDDKWIRYNPTSYSGVSVDVGIFGSIYGVTLSAGVSTIAFKYIEMTIGIGYMF